MFSVRFWIEIELVQDLKLKTTHVKAVIRGRPKWGSSDLKVRFF